MYNTNPDNINFTVYIASLILFIEKLLLFNYPVIIVLMRIQIHSFIIHLEVLISVLRIGRKNGPIYVM